MRNNILLCAISALILVGTALANQGIVHFCVDLDNDEECDEEFDKTVELDGLTDMDLLEMALQDELNVDNWEDYLWAVGIQDDQGYNDYLPQFYDEYEVNLTDGGEAEIWWTEWQWHPPGSSPPASSTPEPTPLSGSAGIGSSAGSPMSGQIPSGSAKVTAVSSRLRGYTVEVDGALVGTEGSGTDALDGIYTFYVAGNQRHSIKASHPLDWKSWDDFFAAGGSYTANIDIAGRVVRSG
jgi:hypothetical protein